MWLGYRVVHSISYKDMRVRLRSALRFFSHPSWNRAFMKRTGTCRAPPSLSPWGFWERGSRLFCQCWAALTSDVCLLVASRRINCLICSHRGCFSDVILALMSLMYYSSLGEFGSPALCQNVVSICALLIRYLHLIIEQQISILEWFLKDHVTLKTGVTMLKIQLWSQQ